jgi:hypothetical protein
VSDRRSVQVQAVHQEQHLEAWGSCIGSSMMTRGFLCEDVEAFSTFSLILFSNKPADHKQRKLRPKYHNLTSDEVVSRKIIQLNLFDLNYLRLVISTKISSMPTFSFADVRK